MSSEETAVLRSFSALGYGLRYDPRPTVHHLVHADRLRRAWLYSRYFWQGASSSARSSPRIALAALRVISDALSVCSSVATAVQRVAGLQAQRRTTELTCRVLQRVGRYVGRVLLCCVGGPRG